MVKDSENLLAKRLINVTYGVYKVFDLLTQSFSDKNLYQKNLDYLKVALEIEDDLYNEIGEDLLTSMKFLNAINIAVEDSDIDDFILEEITTRILSYINSIINKYPFVEDRFYEEENVNSNILTIDTHIKFDIDLIAYSNLMEFMRDNNFPFLNPYLYDTKHLFLFETKYYNHLAFEDDVTVKPSARERLLAFGHDERLVNDRFNEVICNGLSSAISDALAYDKSPKEMDDYSNMIISLLQVKNYLCITSKKEAFNIFRDYYRKQNSKENKEILDESSVNKMIKELIKNNYIEKSNIKKPKVYSRS